MFGDIDVVVIEESLERYLLKLENKVSFANNVLKIVVMDSRLFQSRRSKAETTGLRRGQRGNHPYSSSFRMQGFAGCLSWWRQECSPS